MKLEPLSPEQLDDARALVDETIAGLPDTSGRRAFIRLGIYSVVWTVTSLDEQLLSRAALQLQELGFSVDEIRACDIQQRESEINETFFAVAVKRVGLFHPDYLFGEAVAITTICQQWECLLDSFSLDTIANRAAGRSLYGPFGKSIA